MIIRGDRAAIVVVGVDDALVEADFVDPTIAFDETCLEIELALDAVRQTGGFGAVVSANAESNREVGHGIGASWTGVWANCSRLGTPASAVSWSDGAPRRP